MVTISAKVTERLTKGIKKYQPILAKARATDINESDTVTIITDILCEVFGYDKYENVTSEFAIKKTYCDLAIKLDGTVPLLLECKAAGIDLKDDHVRQATNYCADSGIEWVALTNGLDWRIYKVIFSKPVERTLVYEFDFCKISAKKQSDLEMLYYLCIEAFSKSSKATLEELHIQKQVINRYIISQVILSDTVLDALRRSVRKLFPDVKVTNEELSTIIGNEIIKREAIEGEAADDAKKRIKKAERAMTQKMKKDVAVPSADEAEEV